MFDTVTLQAYDVDINPNQFDGIIPFTYINDEGNYISRYSFNKERIDYRYTLQTKFLQIELSIPKMIYGTNTRMIMESDINIFWLMLQRKLQKHLNINVNKEQWKVKRLDISYNFQVDDVEAYIREINKKTISKRDKITYNENETVIFKNKSSSICFYDKEKECINNKEPQNVIEQAKGLLRLEIRPATYHIRGYSRSKKAVDLITTAYFLYIIEKFNISELLKFQADDLEDNELFRALTIMKVADVEKALGFKILVDEIGEKTLLEKQYFKEGTYRNRKKLLDDYIRIANGNKNINHEQLHIKLH